MNYDLITKLAKLANNNPNENEANAAARKVCRLLAEGKFNFNNHTPPTTPNKPQPKQEYTRRPEEDMYDIFRDIYGKGYRPGRGWERSDYQSPFDQEAQDKQKRAQEARQQAEYQRQEEIRREKIRKQEEEMKKNYYEQKPLKCSKCGKTKNTAFGGDPRMFVCFGCQWHPEDVKI